MSKKAQSYGLGALISVVIIFLIAGLVAIFSLDILEDTREDFCDYTYNELYDTCVSCDIPATPTYNATDNLCHNATEGNSSTPTARSEASFNSTTDSMDGVAKIPDKMPTLGNVVIAAIIIGVLLAAFGGFLAAKQFG